MHRGDPRRDRAGGAAPGWGALEGGPRGCRGGAAQPGLPPGVPGCGSGLPWDPTRGGLEGPRGVGGVPRGQRRDWGRWGPSGVGVPWGGSHAGGGVPWGLEGCGDPGAGAMGRGGPVGVPFGKLWGSRGDRGWGPLWLSPWVLREWSLRGLWVPSWDCGGPHGEMSVPPGAAGVSIRRWEPLGAGGWPRGVCGWPHRGCRYPHWGCGWPHWGCACLRGMLGVPRDH